MRLCTRCKGELPDYRASHYCRECAKVLARERRAREPEKVRAADRERYRKRSAAEAQRRREYGRLAYQKKRLERATGRLCDECGGPIPTEMVLTRKTCSEECRKLRSNKQHLAYFYARQGRTPDHDETSRRRSEAMRKWWADPNRHVNPRACRACGVEFTPASPSGRFCSPGCRRLQTLALRYGTEAAALRALLDAQGESCAICGERKRGWARTTIRKDALVVDHCHKTGKVRGFLCGDCNTAIGRFGDDPARLRAAADYIEGCA